MSNIDEINKLHELKDKGALIDSEFEKMKRDLIENGKTPPFSTQFENATKDIKENDWAMFMHLSQLAGFIIPGLGFLAPIVMWLMKKDDSRFLDNHGRVIVNWMISAFIYSFVGVILMFILIGIPLLIALGFLAVLFPIIAGIKAKDGKMWPYPMSIHFLKVDKNF